MVDIHLLASSFPEEIEPFFVMNLVVVVLILHWLHLKLFHTHKEKT